MADFSADALNNVRTKDLGAVGDMLSSVVTELKSFDVEEEEKGFFGFFKRGANKMTALKAKIRQGGSQCRKDLRGFGAPSGAVA